MIAEHRKKIAAFSCLGLLSIALPSAFSVSVACTYMQPLPDEIHFVIQKQSVGMLKKWIAWDAETLNEIDPESGRTPLMTALIYEKPKHFQVLLSAGADANQIDRVGNSALHVAAQVNEPWHVLTLLNAGANPHLRNAQGQTFQRYLFMTREHLLTAQTRKGLAAVREWLNANKIELETELAR